MRYVFAIATLIASLGQVSLLRADEDLFSTVAMESVFTKSVESSTSVAAKVGRNQYDRVTSTESLSELLKSAGLEPTSSKDRVKVQLPHEGWKFPVSLAIQIDQDRIDCRMSLIVVGDGGTATETLLALLAVGDSGSGAFFAYDRERKLIQARTSLSNRSVTPDQLKADLEKLAVFAEQHSKTWMKLQKTKAKTSQPAKPSPAQPNVTKPTNSTPAKPAPPQLSLVGSWSASLSSGESFAIQMTGQSKFQLVHLKSGKPTISKGTTTRSGNRLTLIGNDGTRLNCQVEQTTADKFRLTILNSQGKATVNLDFKKAG